MTSIVDIANTKELVARSHKVYVNVNEEWVTNGLRFANEDEALRYAEDISARWVAIRAYDVQPSVEEPNAQMLRFGNFAKVNDKPEGA